MTTFKQGSKLLAKLGTFLITLGTLNAFLATPAIASTEQQADELFAKRGTDVKYAKQAEDIYRDLAEQASHNQEKARLTLKQVKAVYAVASFTGGKDGDKKTYSRASELAKTVVDLFGDPEDGNEEDLRVQALYWYAASLAKTRSLSGASKVETAVNEVLEDYPAYSDFYYHGVYRVMGRVYYKVPRIFKIGQKKDKALEYLEKAFLSTLKDGERVSVYGLNNLFYADILKYFKRTNEACEVLKVFSRQDPATLLLGREVENSKEIEEAKEKLKDFKCL